MGASSSLVSKATAEQQAEINAEVERMKGEGVSEEEIEKQLKEKYAELLNAVPSVKHLIWFTLKSLISNDRCTYFLPPLTLLSSFDMSSIQDARCIVVIGAAGLQGGGVVKTLSGKDGWTVRAVTRNPDSDKAKALAEMPGVTVVSADMNDEGQLTEAFKDAYGVFCVTK